MSQQITDITRPILYGPHQFCWFVGSNPSPKSFQTNSYYAHSTNQFWRLLFDAGFTPILLNDATISQLQFYHIGLIDLSERSTKSTSELRRSELIEGIKRILTLIITFQPKCIATNGIMLGKLFLHNLQNPCYGNHGSLRNIFTNILPHDCETKLWILPSSSGRAGVYHGKPLTYQDKVNEWKRFQRVVKNVNE